MARVAAEQLVRSLADQRDLDVLRARARRRSTSARSTTTAIGSSRHRDDAAAARARSRRGSSCDRRVARAEERAPSRPRRRVRRPRKLRAVADGVGRPVAAVQVHQRQQQPGIDAAAQQQPDRHVAEQMPLQRALVEVEQLFGRLGVGLRRRRTALRPVAGTSARHAQPPFSTTSIVPGASLRMPL